MNQLPFAKHIKPKRTDATRRWEWQKKQTQKAIDRISKGKEFRKEIRDRDRNICCLCGSLLNLCVHHIDKRFAKREFDSKNCITVCDTCHKKIHRHMKYYRPILLGMIKKLYEKTPEDTLMEVAGGISKYVKGNENEKV